MIAYTRMSVTTEGLQKLNERRIEMEIKIRLLNVTFKESTNERMALVKSAVERIDSEIVNHIKEGKLTVAFSNVILDSYGINVGNWIVIP